MKNGYFSCISSDEYLPGLLVLNENIKNICHNKLNVICKEDFYIKNKYLLDKAGIAAYICKDIKPDREIISRLENTTLIHWINTFFKLNIFDLTDFDKIIYIDSDIFVLENLDFLFDYESITAVDDGDFMNLSYKKGMNSGLLIFKPNHMDYLNLVNSISSVGKEREFLGDQGVIQTYFSDFKEKSSRQLPVGCNACFYLLDKYHKLSKVYCVHFIGANKPWSWKNAYAYIRIYSYFFRGRFKTFYYTRKYYKSCRRIIRKYRLNDNEI